MNIARATSLIVALALLLPGAAVSQESLSFDGHVGIALPQSDFEKIADTGTELGVGVIYPLWGEAAALRADVGYGMFGGADAELPDMQLIRVGGGVQFNVVRSNPFTAKLGVGAGTTFFRSDSAPFLGGEVETRWPTVYGFVEGGYQLSQSLALSVGTRPAYSYSLAEDLQPLMEKMSLAQAEVWSVPPAVRIKDNVVTLPLYLKVQFTP